MPTSATGMSKSAFQSGYTLIEILGVLVILSLIGLLAFPNYTRGEEKAYLKQIGKLIQADLLTVSEEAACGKSEILVEFIGNGYHFELGDREIKRSFNRYQFQWDFSLNELKESAVIDGTETFDLPAQDDEAPSLGRAEWCFSGDGVFPESTLEWVSQNFTGTMVLNSVGEIKWEFTAKRTGI